MKAYELDAGVEKVISKVRSVTGPSWRMVKSRGSVTVPLPASSTSTPWAAPGGCPASETRNRTDVPRAGGPMTRCRSRAWNR